MKKKISQKAIERILYIAIIIALTLYGIFKDSEVAQALMHSVSEAFSILLN
jgi:hypothetical protein